MKEKVIVTIVILMFSSVRCNSDGDSKILKLVNNVSENGYDFEFKTSNGITRKETGILKPTTQDQDKPVLTVQGEFSFNFPDGTPILVTFTSDENGYRPKVQIGTRTTAVVKGETEVTPVMLELGNRHNFDARSGVSSSAIATLAGGGIGK